MPRVWLGTFARPAQMRGRIPHVVRPLEAAGAYGWWTADSPALGEDPYVVGALATQATTTLCAAVMVTNAFTRHPMITAATAASIHLESSGRFVLGIGRGDSALAHLGLGPSPVASFERYLIAVQTYLRGEAVPFEPVPGMPEVASLAYSDTPHASRITWLPADVEKVPVVVAASGPRMMAVAGRQADQVLLAVGCEEARVRWGIDLVREAAVAAGRDPSDVRIMLTVTYAINEDRAIARRMIAANVAAQARFAAMQGRPSGTMSESDKDMAERARDYYDMNLHGQQTNTVAEAVDDDFIERHAVVGSPEEMVDRLRVLEKVGVDDFMLGYGIVNEPEWRESERAMLENVLPALK